MQQVIYADVLFLVDLSMDFLALYIVSYMLRINASKYCLAFSASLGALYSVINVIVRHDSLILTLAIAVLMIIAAFGFCSISRIAIRAVVFFVVNFILGGAMTAIFNLFNSFGKNNFVMIYGEISEIPKKMTFEFFVVGFALTAAVCVIFLRAFLPKACVKYVSGDITFNGKTERYKLLCDSGALLTEPISGEPVIFLSKRAMTRLIGDKIFLQISQSNPDFLEKNIKRARLVLYRTAGGRSSSVCIKADNVRIEGKNCRAWLCTALSESCGCGDGIAPASLLT